MAIAQPQTVARLYRDFDDFLRIRQFLIDTYRLNGCYHNWEIRRWEGQWFWGDLASSLEWAAGLRIWETEQGEIAGAVHADWPGSAVLQVHPTFRHLEEEMLAWAESHLALPNAEGKPQLEMEVYDYDLSRQELLARRGYAKTGGYGYLRWRTLAKPIPAAPPTPGYVLRSLNTDVDDAVRYAAVVNTVFPRSCSTPEVVVRFSASPSYRSDLHLVAEAEDGTFAAFASLTVDSAIAPPSSSRSARTRTTGASIWPRPSWSRAAPARRRASIRSTSARATWSPPTGSTKRSAHRLRHDLQLAKDFR